MDNYMNIVIKAMKQWVTNKFSSWDLAIDNKVDKIKGKGLSTEDYTTEEKEKLASINLEAMLPEVTEENNGNVLTVVDGTWTSSEIEIPSPLPEVTEENNGEVLAVVEGEWSTKYIPEQKQADWDQVDSTAVDYIKNKPILTKSYLVLKDKNTNLDYQLAIEDGVLISELMRYFIDITVKTLPTKNIYIIGEQFDPTGMVLLATDINNTSIEITDGYIYPENQLKHTDEIIISYVHNGITYTINLNTTININGIEIFTLPNITNYTEGQVFNPTGMVVGVKGENDYFEIITDYSYNTNPLTVDMNSIDISYNYNDIVYTASVPITVVALDIALQDFTYTNKDNGDVELNTWKETYNGENSTDIIIPNYSSIII